MYNSSIASVDFASKLFYAKDLFYLLISELNNLFFDSPKFIFFSYICLSFFVKFYLFSSIKIKSHFLVVVSYVILLSTVLEFVAFRSALSLSFFLVALSKRDSLWMYFWFALATIAHNSAVLPILCAFPFFSGSLFRRWLLYLASFLSPFFLYSFFISYYPQGENYIQNQNGTSKALILPISVLLASYLIYYNFNHVISKNPENITLKFIRYSKVVIFALIFFSIGITPFVVIAATRYLEVVYILLLIAGVTLYRKSVFNFLGFVFLISILIYLNIMKDLWLNMFSPSSS